MTIREFVRKRRRTLRKRTNDRETARPSGWRTVLAKPEGSFRALCQNWGDASGLPVRVRVCIVSPYDPRPVGRSDPLAVRGGVEESLDRCASGLARRGHDVTILTSAVRDSVERGVVRFIRIKRRGVLFRNPIAPFARSIPKDTDVVHVPATYPLVSDLIPWRLAQQRRPTVLDYHFDVHGSSLAMRLAARVHAATLARGMRRATRIVAKSADYASSSPFLSSVDKFDVVPNGVDVNEFPLGRGPRAGIVCVGRLVPYKGVDVLLRAMPRVFEETGESLTVIGDGPEREALERAAPSCVRFAGRVSRDVLVRAYGAAKLCVLPSVNSQEAFGIALLESMASGTPVVASALPGVREVAQLGGALAPPGDAGELAEAIIRELRQQRSPQALRDGVSREFGWDRVVERLERVYDSAVAQA